MNKYKTIILVLLIISGVNYQAFSQERIRYSLGDIIDRAKSMSPAALRAETQRQNLYWQYRFYKSNYNPQLRLSGTLPSYSQEVRAVEQNDGSIEYLPLQQSIVDVGLGLQQSIALTGGNISINTSTTQYNNYLVDDPSQKTRWQGVPVNVQLYQPIFAFNQLKWDKLIEPLRYEQSKKGYVEEMEQISERATQLFFSYLLSQVSYDIAMQNKTNMEGIYKIEQGRYNIGTTTEDQLLQVELQVLQADQDLASAQLALESTALALRSYIGLNENVQFDLLLPDVIPQFDVDVDKAISLAFENRSDAVDFEIRRKEADEQLARAKGQRFNLDVNARYGYNNAASTWGGIYDQPDQQAVVSLGVSVPVLDWGRNKARMGIARANQELVTYTVQQDMITFEQEIFTQVKNFQQLRDRIIISEKADEVAAKRYEISRQRYLSGKMDITNLNIAQTEKDSNKQSYISSLREYWLAYYELRQLTLYDFERQKLLYDAEAEMNNKE